MIPYLLILMIGHQFVEGAELPDIEPFKLENTLLYYTKLNLVLVDDGEGRTRRNVSLVSNAPTDIIFNKDNGSFALTASTPGSVELSVNNFKLSVTVRRLAGPYWTLSNLTMSADGKVNGHDFKFQEAQMLPPGEIVAPLTMSFHCSRLGPWMAKESGDKTGNFTPQLEFRDFQMESFMKDNSKFGPSYDCVGFFSIGILSGVFVTILLLSILTWGISMVMSVKTMDRFDDPKSKPISVGTSD